MTTDKQRQEMERKRKEVQEWVETIRAGTDAITADAQQQELIEARARIAALEQSVLEVNRICTPLLDNPDIRVIANRILEALALSKFYGPHDPVVAAIKAAQEAGRKEQEVETAAWIANYWRIMEENDRLRAALDASERGMI